MRAATDVEAFYRARAPEPCAADTLLVLSVDGKGIVMRPEALTDATRKAAEAKGGNKMRTRPAGGEKSGRKRMAMLGAVYDADPASRAVDDDTLALPAPDSDGEAERKRGPEAFNKWLTGSVTDNTQTVISAVFDDGLPDTATGNNGPSTAHCPSPA